MRLNWAVLAFVGASVLCQAQQDLVLKDVRVIDGAGGNPIPNAIVTVHNGHILSVRKVSGTATRTLMPGIINAHGHLGLTLGTKVSAGNYTRENVLAQVAQYRRYGITAILSLGMNKDLLYGLRGDSKAGGTEIFTADRGFGVKGGAPPVATADDQVYRPETAEQARAMVREAAARHPNFIKIWLDDVNGTVPKMKPEIYQAVISEAHQHHLRVAAHVYYLDDAKSLVSAGIDVLAHSIRDREVDTQLLNGMKRHGVYYIPALGLEEAAFIYAEAPQWIADPFFTSALSPGVLEMLKAVKPDPKMERAKAAFAMSLKNVKTVFDSGVKVGFGTDSGAQPMRVQGWAEHRELQLLVQAGLTPMQAIVSATHTNAEMLGVANRMGRIQPGKESRLLLLEANPLDDIRNTTKISGFSK